MSITNKISSLFLILGNNYITYLGNKETSSYFYGIASSSNVSLMILFFNFSYTFWLIKLLEIIMLDGIDSSSKVRNTSEVDSY